MTFFLYLAKVALCSAILLGYYWLFLRNKRFHHYNRFYLLAVLLISVLLPFIKIPLLYQPADPVNHAVYQAIDVLTVNRFEEEPFSAEGRRITGLLTAQNGLYGLYLAGAAVLLTVFIRSLFSIRRITRRYPFERIESLKFYNTREPGTPFSFFRAIFWNDRLNFNSREGQQIFRHEVFHVKQQHSLDIIAAELLTILFWFNPFFHLIKKELKAIHEFLADQYAASGDERYAYAELLVQQSLAARKIAISNPFFQNHIKRRIAMITQFNQTRYGYWSRLMVLPVSVILFCAFTLYTSNTATNNKQESFTNLTHDVRQTGNKLTVVVDAGHGGTDHGAKSRDEKILEKDIALQISRSIQQLAPEYNINVVMTRENDHVPGQTNNINEGLQYRTAVAGRENASLFVSIHVSAAPDVKKGDQYVPNPRSGFELYITNQNEQTMAPSRKLGTHILNSLSTVYKTRTAILQRSEKGIWVLDKAPCPAVLIECGFITNEKDLAFITQQENQAAIARKILEGISSYTSGKEKSTPVSVKAPRTATGKQSVPVSVPATVPVFNDSVQKAIMRYYMRSLRYPQPARQHKLEETVYLSMIMKQDGHISNLTFYDAIPAGTSPDQISKLYIKGYYHPNDQIKDVAPLERKAIFKNEIIAVTEKHKPLQQSNMTGDQKYFLQITFELEENPGAATTTDNSDRFQVNHVNGNIHGISLNSNADTTPVLLLVEIEPAYRDGQKAWQKYVQEKLQYPPQAAEQKIEGEVLVEFIVDKEGNTSNIKAIRGPRLLRDEAVRVIKESGRWLPAIQHGQKVKAIVQQPVAFKLDKFSKNS